MAVENPRRRVAVTGLGVASAIGFDEETFWQNLLAGRTGIGPLQFFDRFRHERTGYHVTIGAEADSDELKTRLRAMGRRPVDRALDLAMVAGQSALEDAGLLEANAEGGYAPRPASVIIGSGVGSAQSHFEGFKSFHKKGAKGLRPTTVPKCMYNAISSGLSLHFKLTGANYVVVSACTSGANAIGAAYRSIRDGYADMVVTGGADGFFDPFFYGVWNNLGVLASGDDPVTACRPFDRDRTGCILGEGAGVLVLESFEHAERRGARQRGEVAGYGESSDAFHRTTPSAEGQAAAMRQALDDAGVDPAELGYINAHGTATEANDECESRSIRLALGDAADDVWVGANKSFFGHTLGASGALETIVTLLALEHRQMPPNLNLDNPDPEVNLRLLGGEPQVLDSAWAMKNSFGFGGGNGVLVLKRAD